MNTFDSNEAVDLASESEVEPPDDYESHMQHVIAGWENEGGAHHFPGDQQAI